MATFGDTTAGGSTFPSTNDRAIFGQFVLIEEAQIESITCFFDTTSAAGANFKGLIYSDVAGVPSARLAVGAAVAVPAGGGALTSAVTPFVLAAGTYWIGAVVSDFQPVWDADSGLGGQREEAAQGMSYASPPATFTSSGTTADRVSAYVTYTPTSELTQTGVPISTVTAGSWQASGAGGLFAQIDETVASDADYIVTAVTADSCEFAITVLGDPYSSLAHEINYRIRGDGTSGMVVGLYQGASLIASWTHDPAPASYTTFNQTLTGPQADSITDYGDLRLRFTEI